MPCSFKSTGGNKVLFRLPVGPPCADTLHRDLTAVRDLFQIKRFALFDQFPYTHHVEC